MGKFHKQTEQPIRRKRIQINVNMYALQGNSEDDCNLLDISLRTSPPRHIRERYAEGIIALFPCLRDPFSKKGYVSTVMKS